MMKNHKRAKILVLPSRSWYPTDTKPELGVFVKDQVKAISHFHDVIVLYCNFGLNRSFINPFKISDKIEDGIRTIRIDCRWRIPLSNRVLYYFAIVYYFHRLLKQGWKPNVIHAHVFLAGVPALMLSWFYKIPFVITEHWTGFVRGVLTWRQRLSARLVMERAGMVLPVSTHLKHHIEAYGIKARFKIIPNMVDTELFYHSTIQDRRKGKKTILSVTSLTPKKGVSCLLQALSRVKHRRQDFMLDIVGDGPNRNEYAALADKLRLGGIVTFLGSKAKWEVAQLMSSCDFFVQASLFETFGIVYIEAMACGKPVITSDIGGPNEIIPSYAGILVPPGDIKALAEAIESMLDNFSSYSSDKISRYVKESFSYESVGKQLSESYKALLSEEK